MANPCLFETARERTLGLSLMNERMWARTRSLLKTRDPAVAWVGKRARSARFEEVMMMTVRAVSVDVLRRFVAAG